jgi:outer membrane immunogenic protein
MRRAFASALACALFGAGLASPVLADGMAYGSPPADFSGFGIGLDFGAALGSVGGANLSGPAGGVHVGYNLQTGGVVGGAEVDAIFGGVDSGSFGAGSFSQNFLSSTRAKAGYAFGPMLAYGTVGWAFSTTAYEDASGTANKTIHGGVFGAGLEYALTRSVSIRGEYLYYDFDRATYVTPLTVKSMTTSTNFLRVGATLHF